MMNVLLYFALVPNTSPCYVNFVKKKMPKGNGMKWFFYQKVTYAESYGLPYWRLNRYFKY